MVNCPVCQAEIAEDFGLVTCSSCGSQVLLELDGAAATPPVYVEAPTIPVEQPSPNISDMSDVADFGNSSVSQGREGLLRFNIYIAGIDTSDIRAEVREALDDAKFLWDVDAIIGSVKNGELAIKEITPVKSALLVQKLRTISVEVRWEQYAIHQA